MTERTGEPKHPVPDSKTLSRLIGDVLSMLQWLVNPNKQIIRTIAEQMTEDELHASRAFLHNSSRLARQNFYYEMIRSYRDSRRMHIPPQNSFVVKIADINIINIDYAMFWKRFSELNQVPVPPSYSQEPDARLKEVLKEINDFRSHAIEKLQVSLNSYLGAIAESQVAEPAKKKSEDLLSLQDKREIVAIVNAGLNSIGAAIKHKGEECYLGCTTGTAAGRFMIVPKGAKTAVLARVNLADFLPLELVDTIPPGVELGHWVNQAKATSGREKS